MPASLRPARLLALALIAPSVALAGATSSPASADATPSTVTNITVGEYPGQVGVDPTTHTVYASNYLYNTITVIDGTTDAVTTAFGGDQGAYAIDFDSAAHRAYVVNLAAYTLSVIDTTTNSITATIPVGPNPQGVAVDPVHHTVYVSNTGGHSVSVIDAATNTVMNNIPVGAFPEDLAVDTSTDTLYVANSGANTVSVVDLFTESVTATIPVGARPTGLALDPTNHTVYVANQFGGTVSVIDGQTNTVAATVPVGSHPYDVAVDPGTHNAYVSVQLDSKVSIIDGRTRTVAGTVALAQSALPYGIAVDPSNHKVYTANQDGTVSAFLAPATVTGVAPGNGPLTGGTEVTITGTGFTGATAVDFGSGHVTDFTVDSDSQITAVAPPSTSIRDRHIWVTTPSGVSDVTSADLFSYRGAAPAVDALSPTSGPQGGGTEVTITGAGFDDATAVIFGTAGAADDFTIDSDTQITAIAPEASSTGVRNVRVTTSTGGTSPVVTAARYAYTAAAPTITDVTPATGPIEGGTTVIITGTDFTDATRVVFGSAGRALFHVDSPTQITATSPPSNLAGIRNIRVRSASGTSPTVKADRFTYTADD